MSWLVYSYLESANSEVDEFLLPLQLQLKLPNKLAAAKQKNEDRNKKQDVVWHLEKRASSSLAAEGRMVTIRSTWRPQRCPQVVRSDRRESPRRRE